jgi:ABC-type lipoprotein export system ATPase subunit
MCCCRDTSIPRSTPGPGFNRPQLLLADEPTGNLDAANKQNVVDLLIRQAREHGSTLLMVTHDRGLLEAFERVIDLEQILGRRG